MHCGCSTFAMLQISIIKCKILNMKVAVVGSRGIKELNLKQYLPNNVSEIISGGAKGVDSIARDYAQKEGIPLREIFPDYKLYKKAAPLRRNIDIIIAADIVYVFWDGESKGSEFVIKKCEQFEIPCVVFIIK